MCTRKGFPIFFFSHRPARSWSPPFFFLLLLFCCKNVFAQHYFIVNNYSSKNGLPQNSVRSMVLDARGFLWMATESGLVRFGGNKLMVFNSTTHPDFGSDRISNLYKTPDNKIYFAIANSPAIFGISDTVYTIRKKLSADGLVTSNSPLMDSMGAYGRLLHANFYLHDSLLFGYRKFYLMPLEGNKFLTVIKKEFILLDGNTQAGQVPFGKYDPVEIGVLGRNILFFDKDRQLFQVDFEQKTIHPCQLTGALQAGRFTFRQPNQGNLFSRFPYEEMFLTSGESLFSITPTGKPYQYQTHLAIASLPANSVIVSLLYHKNYRQYFIGTASKGLYVYKQPDIKSLVYQNPGGAMSPNVYYNQAALDSHTVFVSPGLEFNIDGARRSHLSMPTIFTTLFKKSGGPLLYFDDSLAYGYHPTTKASLQMPGTTYGVACWAKAKDGLWMAGKKGISYMRQDSVKHFLQLTEAESRNLIQTIYEQADGSLLCGTIANLLRIDVKTKKIDTIPNFNGKNIRSINYIGDALFICTYGSGIYMQKNGRWMQVPLDKQQSLLYAHYMINPTGNDVWIPTNKGLFRTGLKELIASTEAGRPSHYYYFYGETDGMLSEEFNLSTSEKYVSLANGYISLPSMEGMVMFNPTDCQPYLPSEGIFIDQVVQDQQQSIPHSPSISLPHGFQNVTINFSTPYWGNEENLWLSYQLVGFHKTPLPLEDGERKFSIGTIASGRYTLKIMKRAGFGPNDMVELQIPFEVRQAWYETAGFLGGMAMALVVFTLLLINLIQELVAARNKSLRKAVNDKTQELLQANAELATSLENLSASEKVLTQSLHMKDKLIAVISHDLLTPLRYIGVITRMARQELAPGDGRIESTLREVEAASAKLYESTSNTLTWIKFQNQGASLAMEDLAIHYLVEELIDRVVQVLSVKNIVIKNLVDEDHTLYTEPRVLEIILQNLLDNALKYTEKGEITLSSAWRAGEYEIVVADTGKGISPERLTRINEFIEDNKNSILPDGLASGSGGLGLVIVKELLAILGGTYYFESTEGAFTKVHVLLKQK